MAEATDIQMQHFADERLRPRAEQIRALFLACADDQGAIDDCYARGVGSNRWNDGRDNGPPHLLKSGNSASPDDLLNYNAALGRIAQFRAGTFASLGEANEFASLWAVLQDAAVRPVGG